MINQRKITPRTRAVIAVHLLGGPCDMDPLMEVARRRGVAVVEDCAQCVGGSYRGRKLGSIGDVGIYSFQINKMITAGKKHPIRAGVLPADPWHFRSFRADPHRPQIHPADQRLHHSGDPGRVWRDRMTAGSERTLKSDPDGDLAEDAASVPAPAAFRFAAGGG